MAVLCAAVTLAGGLVALGQDLYGPRAVAVVVLLVVAGASAVLLVVRGASLPRRVLGGLVHTGGVGIGLAQLVPQEPQAALAITALLSLVVVEVSYFFPAAWVRRHMPALVLLSNGTLLLRGDVHVGYVLAIDAVLLALGLVTSQLAERALGAHRDPLTGLPNRRSSDDRLQALVAAGGTFSVALLDLDHFKEVNDTAGHEAGDRVLLRVARLPARVLPPGAVLARQGGDEFVLLLPGRDGDQAVVDVWRVCDALAGIGLSCGVAQHQPGDTVAQLMRRADGALYAAKSAGRGRVELAAATGTPA
ncbi:diguanylate cyclase (GGDEF) domain-containing protein [Klenkia marina]|uniref:Diguanylate cyclase (GGDEF) domain-containing protein n=2 Tax=Klenkia marina TaxID=1960309 RepID=A0A1G4YTB2_9ACTN|nr:diguanylate cyclase (GGDEF) domain-containing protein [Klenkia marina]